MVKNISGNYSSSWAWALGVFHTYSYNHARRLRLEKLLFIKLFRSPSGYLNRFWIQLGRYVAVLEFKALEALDIPVTFIQVGPLTYMRSALGVELR